MRRASHNLGKNVPPHAGQIKANLCSLGSTTPKVHYFRTV